MQRRLTRQRREYLYRKSLEGQAREQYEKQRRLKEALEEGKTIPTELRAEQHKLKKKNELEDDNTAVVRSHIDDEYAQAGLTDPRILITTSRDPSSRLLQFAKEMKLVIPNAERINRGNTTLDSLVDSARTYEFSDIIVFQESKGNPDSMIVCHLPFGPTAHFTLHHTVLRHDIGTKKEVGTLSQAYPHLIFEGFTTKLGERTMNILKHLFPVPKPDTKRIITFQIDEDYISFRHHMYEMRAGVKSIKLNEMGPRFEMWLHKIILGTMDQKHAESEYSFAAFTRSAKKPKLSAPKSTEEIV